MAQENRSDTVAPHRNKAGIPGVFGGMVVGILVGAVIWYFALQSRTGPTVPPGAQTAATEAPTARSAPSAPETLAGQGSAPQAKGPGFDTVRSEADGSVLVAGRAEAGARVSIEVNGVAVAEAKADAQGKFAAFLSLPAGTVPNVVTLSAIEADGTEVRSDQTVILKPVGAPAQVASTGSPAAGAAPTGAPDAVSPGTAAETPAPPLALLADPAGVRKLAAGASDRVVIDTISYGADGAVELAGRALAGAEGHVRAYLDNAEAGTAPVAVGGGWTMRLTDVSPRLYTLRVDQLDDSGTVVSRFETPFLREDMAKVAPAAGQARAGVAAPEAATGGTAVSSMPATAGQAQTPGTGGVQGAGSQSADPLRAGIVTVQPGYTLWAIARSNYGSGVLYVKVFEANRDQIRNPDLIYPGQVFSVPND